MNDAKRSNLNDAYFAAHAHATSLLEQLQATIQDMPAPDNDEYPIHWGHVGSLNYLCQQLTELNEHFTSGDNA